MLSDYLVSEKFGKNNDKASWRLQSCSRCSETIGMTSYEVILIGLCCSGPPNSSWAQRYTILFEVTWFYTRNIIETLWGLYYNFHKGILTTSLVLWTKWCISELSRSWMDLRSINIQSMPIGIDSSSYWAPRTTLGLPTCFVVIFSRIFPNVTGYVVDLA